MPDTSLHTAYRPKTWKEVIGQETVVKSLQARIEKKRAHAYLLSGPSGTGKTTLARVAARALGCDDRMVEELAAAVFTGVEAMRAVVQGLMTLPMMGDVRVLILDECHRLSKNAWDAVLKALEEPPDHVYFFLCTTELGKVPETIKTRCVAFTLKPIPDELIRRVLIKVADKEDMKASDAVIDVAVREAHGSVRQALVNLEEVGDLESQKEAREVLRSIIETEPAIDLARFFLAPNRGSWAKAMAIFDRMADENPESVRIVVVNYLGGALKKAKGDGEATKILQVLDAFASSYNPSEGHSPLLLSIGRALFSG